MDLARQENGSTGSSRDRSPWRARRGLPAARPLGEVADQLAVDVQHHSGERRIGERALGGPARPVESVFAQPSDTIEPRVDLALQPGQRAAGAQGHWGQDKPTMVPSSSRSIREADGVAGNPGIVITSPHDEDDEACAGGEPDLAHVQVVTGRRSAQGGVGRERVLRLRDADRQPAVPVRLETFEPPLGLARPTSRWTHRRADGRASPPFSLSGRLVGVGEGERRRVGVLEQVQDALRQVGRASATIDEVRRRMGSDPQVLDQLDDPATSASVSVGNRSSATTHGSRRPHERCAGAAQGSPCRAPRRRGPPDRGPAHPPRRGTSAPGPSPPPPRHRLSRTCALDVDELPGRGRPRSRPR